MCRRLRSELATAVDTLALRDSEIRTEFRKRGWVDFFSEANGSIDKPSKDDLVAFLEHFAFDGPGPVTAFSGPWLVAVAICDRPSARVVFRNGKAAFLRRLMSLKQANAKRDDWLRALHEELT